MDLENDGDGISEVIEAADQLGHQMLYVYTLHHLTKMFFPNL